MLNYNKNAMMLFKIKSKFELRMGEKDVSND